MYSSLPVRKGDPESLTSEFLQVEKNDFLHFDFGNLDNPHTLEEENILAVHFSLPGAQGEPGAVNILYRFPQDIQVLHGNYVFGKLDFDALTRKIPMLKLLDDQDRTSLPYPFGEKLNVPDGWICHYMGALNYFFTRKEIADKTKPFVNYLLAHGGHSWQIFDAVAWFYEAKSRTF